MSTRAVVRENNSKAVERLFAKQMTTTPQGAPSSSSKSKRSVNARDAVGTALVVPQKPEWLDVGCRGNVLNPELDVPSHLGQQLTLALQMGSITPEEHRLLLEEAVKLKADVSEVGCAKRKSCFAMQKDKRWHNAAVDKDDDLLLKRAYRNPQDPSYQKERARDYHRQQSILRYEKTLPRRRAVDPYVSLTGAQVDTRMTVPNQYTAAKLAEREGGKWVLDNPHRQQLSRKQPVMTRVMQGEYYNGQRVPNHRETDFIAANRADVRVASRLNHLRKECADR